MNYILILIGAVLSFLNYKWSFFYQCNPGYHRLKGRSDNFQILLVFIGNIIYFGGFLLIIFSSGFVLYKIATGLGIVLLLQTLLFPFIVTKGSMARWKRIYKSDGSLNDYLGVPLNQSEGEGEEEVEPGYKKPPVAFNNLIEQAGLIYQAGSVIPFTGKAVEYYENGQKKSETEYRNGKKHGRKFTWHKTGQKWWEEKFRDGEWHGKCLCWYKTGQKWIEEEFYSGKKHGKRIAWYETGQKWSYSEYRDDKQHGKEVGWDENGQKRRKSGWRGGKRHGEWIEWYKNGRKEVEGGYLNGKQHGKWTEWYENGQKSYEAEYRDGKVISKKKWDENGKRLD